MSVSPTVLHTAIVSDHTDLLSAKVTYQRCSFCREAVPRGHQCYVPRQPLKPASDKYIAWDTETTQVIDAMGRQAHKINLVKARLFTDDATKMHTFTTGKEFVQWALQQRGYTFI